jgi:hypothetical protein
VSQNVGAPWVPIWSQAGPGADVVCQHGTAADVHCCNCHHGFLFSIDDCECETADDDSCENCGEAPVARRTTDDVGLCVECWDDLILEG